MFYDRKIRYLEEVKDGERMKGSGFVKAEVRNNSCRIFIQIRGLHSTDSFERPVMLVHGKGESLLCKIQITEGRGSTGELCLDSRCLGEERIPYEQIQAIRIPLGAGREIRCLWREAGEEKEREQERGQERRQEREQKREQAGETRADNRQEERAQAEEQRQQEEAGQEAEYVQTEHGQQEELRQQEEAGKQEEPRQLEEPPEWVNRKGTREGRSLGEPASRVIHFPVDSKWQQLAEIYPHMKPFDDEREYLSLGPSDFVIFPSVYYQLVNNSFLLHGYHNYGHILLGRFKRRDGVRYYVGVPGNFYEKEKQVAVMFGFESFECRTEPAGEGDFGYYMMRVEL